MGFWECSKMKLLKKGREQIGIDTILFQTNFQSLIINDDKSPRQMLEVY